MLNLLLSIDQVDLNPLVGWISRSHANTIIYWYDVAVTIISICVTDFVPWLSIRVLLPD